ncbi:zinc finger CCCH domain-containing protein ZFN-like isoform X1 [Dendrobium catenatum]|uniref:Zinc finger ccch domain-containing protein zfN-like protein n=2 Tax=Dendrobium TaxID=37818 RepID=A0A7T0BRE5_DENNO|nr:zinc finger CCCH domain-containing protein ZFN-like isoform X1 [Dendrobium catenatum]PKU74721.1 Zinc finger CCCH domain-containing protein ZFN-like [Dendrobium catenatum]QPJ58224.1 zinc finger ccch domain-containing protein zfN-like protein [Dendrobium nobile]
MEFDGGGRPMEFDGGGGVQLPPTRSANLAVTEASASSPLATSLDEESMWQMSLRVGDNIEPGPFPERPGEADCAYYIRTGLCRFGITCRFNHPPNRKLAVSRMKGGYPERIGQPECQYYLKTGTCKFGPTCKFHHPKDKAGITGRVQVNVLGYPLRPNEKECAYYIRTGQCKFGNTCKFHHPQPSNAMLSLRGSPVYPSVQSPTTPGQQSLTGALTNWPLSKASFISPRWQGSSSYAQLILPQGLVQVPSWSSFPGQYGSASSPENQQQNSGNAQFYGTSHQSETSTGSSASFSSFRFGSVPLGQYALQRDGIFPERPGEPECQFYMKTGDCKFGAVCRFHHPRERLIPAPNCVLSPLGLPLRPGEPLCIFYSRYGICKFGPNCKFDHPVAAPMGIFAYGLSTSSSPNVPVVRRLLGSSSALPALTFSSDGPLEAGPGKSRRLSLSDSQQIDSGDEDVESE